MTGFPSNWLAITRPVNRIFYLMKTAKYCTRGRSWTAGKEQQMERSFWLSWSHGKQLSGGARELVPGSVCRKGLSFRDQQLDRYVSQEPHYPLPFLTFPSFTLPVCLHIFWAWAGWLTSSHSVGPQVNFKDLFGGHKQDTLLHFLFQTTRCSLGTLWEDRNMPFITLDFSADSFPVTQRDHPHHSCCTFSLTA